jgi:uncharacterized protein (TIRG00374 family)
LGVAASALALAVLFSVADIALLGTIWRGLSPSLFALAGILFLVNLALRSIRLLLLAPDRSAPTAFSSWLRLSVAHQAIFMLFPSGTGDAGFPYLASRTVGIDMPSAARMILIYRLQDIWLLLLMSSVGFSLIAIEDKPRPILLVAILLLAAAGLVWFTELARWSARLLAGLLHRLVAAWSGKRRGRLSQDLLRFAQSVDAPIAARRKALCAVAAIGGWLASAAAFWVIFRMIGVSLDPAETMVLIAGVNLAGALASFTIAGIGASEGGLAGMLIILGFKAADAVAIALVARPLLLLNALVVCAIVGSALRLFRRRPS